ncbi:glutathione S-transferase C-terminal domain-containing protein-like [Glandiceps talaboti]
MAETSNDEDSLYLGCYGDIRDGLPLDSQITIFVYTFCQLKSSTCMINFVRIKEERSNQYKTEFQIPDTLQYTMNEKADTPPSVQHCKLPVLLMKKDFTNYCCCGLANILRNLVYKGIRLHPDRNLNALLGYNEVCLKACAETSLWTNLCEVGIPGDVKEFLRSGCDGSSIPSNIAKFEHNMTQPVAMFNINKKRREVLKQKLLPSYTSRYQKHVEHCKDLKDDHFENDDRGVMESVAKIQNMQINDRTSIKTKPVSDSKASENDNIAAEGSIRIQNIGESEKPKQKKKWKNPHSKKIIPDDTLPILPRLFSEGFEETLSDIVLFPSLHLYLSFVMQNMWTHNLVKLPYTIKWYTNVLNLACVSETAKLCGLSLLPLPNIDSDNIDANMKDNSSEVTQKDKKTQSRKTIKTSLRRRVPELLDRLQSKGIEPHFGKHPSDDVELKWNDFPEDVRPVQGGVTELRCQRKCQQVENIVSAVLTIAKNGDTIVDFCCGSGHVGITLAYLLPKCQVYLVENKVESLDRAQSRIHNIQLKNITLHHGNLDYFQGSFDIGVSLHACGVATDMVLDKCISCHAAFVSAPCCYGSIHSTHVITYPRSPKFQQVLSEEEYVLLGHAADQTPWQFETPIARQGKKCMGLIDEDRLEAAKDSGYQVTICTMQPPSCSPKNDLLIGIPSR